jgi:hypothetical protein
VVCRRDYTGLFVARKNEELRTNATLKLPLASARSGIVDVAANRHPICNSLLRLCGNVCRRRQGRVHPRPTEARKRFSLASARAAHPILCMKPIPFLARALAGSGCTVYHTRRRPSQARARIAASFCPPIPFLSFGCSLQSSFSPRRARVG